jgi:serine/threonine protein kinase/tetratricopeptide (TPR) repeat protein
MPASREPAPLTFSDADDRPPAATANLRLGAPAPAGAAPAPAAGESWVGPYRLLRLLGQGGMGCVWLAEQTHPVRRRVALKLIRADLDSPQGVARFEAERQALALMDHPHIARVLDAGTTGSLCPGQDSVPGGAGGQPYLVMELVEGVAVTTFCDQHRLTLRQRLGLFVAVCQAVQHAHGKGVIHRDLKPSNILVSLCDAKPVPKVIDFGLARPAGARPGDRHTVTGHVVGTLEYMAPEQAAGGPAGVDTRADVYSLGVVLHELLTGATPLAAHRPEGATLLEVLQIIQDHEPARPSVRLGRGRALGAVSARCGSDPAPLLRALRGELDWVVMKCLEKDPGRRYETASALAEDVRRYLADEPVLARPPDLGYRVRKFLRRNRAVVCAAALVVLALAAGVVASTAQAYRATRAEAQALRERDEKEEARAEAEASAAHARAAARAAEEARLAAQAQRTQAEDTAGLLESVFHRLNPRVAGGPNVESQLVASMEELAARLEKEYAGQPAVQTRLRSSLGLTLLGLGKTRKAVRLLRAAVGGGKARLGADHPLVLRARANLGLAYREDGQLAASVRTLEQVVPCLVRVCGEEHPDTLSAGCNLATAYQAAGRTKDAAGLYEVVHARQVKALGEDDPATLTTVGNQATNYLAAGRTTDAIALLEQTQARMGQKLGPAHVRTLAVLDGLALAYQKAGRHAEAVRVLEWVRDHKLKALGKEHWETLTTLNNLGTAYHGVGRIDEARKLFEQLHRLHVQKFGPTRPPPATLLANLASVYRASGRLPEAVARLEQARDQQAKTLAPSDARFLDTLHRLAECYQAAGRRDDAVKLYDRVWPRRARVLGPDHADTLETLRNLACACWQTHRLARSVPLYEEALRRHRATLGDSHALTTLTAFNLAVNYRDAGRPDEARRILQGWVGLSRRVLGAGHHLTAFGLQTLALTEARAHRPARAAAAYRALVAGQGAALADGPRADMLAQAGLWQLQAHQAAAAEASLRDALALLVKGNDGGWKASAVRSVLGECLLRQQKWALAEPLLLRGYQGLLACKEKIPPASRAQSMREARGRLVWLYERQGKKDQADRWRKEPPGS